MSASLIFTLLVTLLALVTTGIFFYGAYQILRGPTQKVVKRVEAVVMQEIVPAIQEIGPRIRALMFGWEFPPFNSGGLGVACMGLAKGLVKERTDITFVLPKKLPLQSSDMQIAYANIPEVKAHAVNSPLSPYLNTDSYAKTADGSPLYGSDIVSEVRRYGDYGARFADTTPHDVIYAHDWLSFPAGIKAKKISGKPFVVHVHATQFDWAGERGVNQAIYDIEREGLQTADRVITVSERTKQIIVDRYGIAADKVSVVHNGIDDTTAPTISTTQRLQGLKDAGFQIVLFMGRLTMQKGGDYFLTAAKQVLERNPKTLFVVAGSGDMEHQLVEQAATLGIAGNVLFAGFLRGEEQHEAYSAADVFVMPSVSEPFGITALEAMRIGTPVIISKQSGVAEVAPGALQVDFWDVERMADLISQVLLDPVLTERLVADGKETAERMTWERSSKQVRSILDELVPLTHTA